MNQKLSMPARRVSPQSEPWFRTVLYSIGDAVIVTDREGRVVQMNPVAEKLTGWSEREARGRPLAEVFRILNEETRTEVKDPVSRVLEEGIVVGLGDHTLLVARDGSERFITNSAAPVINEQGEMMGVTLVFRDETADRKAQRALRDAHDFIEGVVATIREPLLVLDGALRVVSANRAFYRAFHTTARETEGRLIYELGGGQWNIPELRRLLEDILPSNSHFDDFEVTHEFERIGRRVMRLNARRIRHDGEETPWILLAIEDVTEQKSAERALQESEAMLRSILMVTPIGIGVAEDRVIRWVNETFCDMVGYEARELVGRNVRFLYASQEEYERAGAQVYKSIREGLKAIEIRLRRKDGRVIDVFARVAFLSPESPISPLVFATMDITERKRMENALRESEERFRSLYENSTVGIYRTTPDGRILLANPALVEFLGYSSFEELAARDLEKEGYASPYTRAQFIEKIEKDGLIRGWESAWLRKDGSVVWVRESARAVRDANGQTLYYDGVVEDVTERKRAEERLHRHALYMEKLNRIITAAASEPDLDGLLETALDEVLEALGLQCGAVWVQGRHVIRGLPPRIRDVAGRGSRRLRLELRGPLVSRDLATEQMDEPYASLASALASEFGIRAIIVAPVLSESDPAPIRVGGLVVCDMRPRAWSGEEITLVEAVGKQLAAAAQRLRLIEHLQEMNTRLEEALRAQKEMVHNVSHELRTPLSVLMGYAELLEAGGLGELTPKQQEALGLIMRYSEELHLLVERLVLMRTLETRPFQQEILDLRAWLLERLRGWRLQARRHNCRLEIELSDGAFTVRADPTLLDEVFVNLLDNAFKFNPEGGVVRVFVRRENGFIIISVSDQGVGIPDGELDKIFEQFYQVSQGLTRRFRGLGLGLSLCKEIVERHGGRIWAESEGEGRGATFYVSLPAYDDS
ncbi:MAG: PAS domain S-box protein [Chloroflexi bacterium]|nr:PAS domain S-box protein [Chloroflexota bacterium]